MRYVVAVAEHGSFTRAAAALHLAQPALSRQVKQVETEVGDVLFAAINVARKLKVDPELALRAASDRFQERVEGAAEIAARDGHEWEALDTEAQLGYYARARTLLGK